LGTKRRTKRQREASGAIQQETTTTQIMACSSKIDLKGAKVLVKAKSPKGAESLRRLELLEGKPTLRAGK